MIAHSPVYEELIDLIAAGVSPEQIVAFRASETTRERVANLIYQEKTSGLSKEERSELDHYMQLEHIMRLAKARARQHIVGHE
jgi:hypothetical protein